MATVLLVITIVILMVLLLQLQENHKKEEQVNFNKRRDVIRAIMSRDPEKIVLYLEDKQTLEAAIEYFTINYGTTAWMNYMQAVTEAESLYFERHGKRP